MRLLILSLRVDDTLESDLWGGVMISEPHLDRLPVVRMAIRCDHRVSHKLPRDGARELIAQSRAPHLQNTHIHTEMTQHKSRQRHHRDSTGGNGRSQAADTHTFSKTGGGPVDQYTVDSSTVMCYRS